MKATYMNVETTIMGIRKISALAISNSVVCWYSLTACVSIRYKPLWFRWPIYKWKLQPLTVLEFLLDYAGRRGPKIARRTTVTNID